MLSIENPCLKTDGILNFGNSLTDSKALGIRKINLESRIWLDRNLHASCRSITVNLDTPTALLKRAC